MSTDPSFTFSAEPDARRLRASLRHFYKRNFRTTRLQGLLILLIGVGLVFADPMVGLFPVVIGIGMLLLVPLLTLSQVTKKIGALLNVPTTYRIDDQGVWVGNYMCDSQYRWRAFTKVDELRGMLLFRLGESGFVAVPTGGLAPETAVAVTAFVRAHVV
jgi:hypothetical protein